MGKVIYLTGVPASGNTTLCERLTQSAEDIIHFRFGRELTAFLEEEHSVTQEELRSGTDHVSTPHIVRQVDERAIAVAEEHRDTKNIVIDTHALTSEAFGFRLTPMSIEQISRLAPDIVVCVTASPAVVGKRILAASLGRPNLNEDQLRQQANLQQSLVVAYSVICGVPAYFIENNDEDQLVANVEQLKFLLT